MDAQEYINFLNSMFEPRVDEKVQKAVKRFRARLGPTQQYAIYTLVQMSLRQITIDAINLMQYSRNNVERKAVIDDALAQIEKIVEKNVRLREFVEQQYGFAWVCDAGRRSMCRNDLIKISINELVRDVVASTCDAFLIALKCCGEEKTN